MYSLLFYVYLSLLFFSFSVFDVYPLVDSYPLVDESQVLDASTHRPSNTARVGVGLRQGGPYL